MARIEQAREKILQREDDKQRKKKLRTRPDPELEAANLLLDSSNPFADFVFTRVLQSRY
jgi:hypothetical protein